MNPAKTHSSPAAIRPMSPIRLLLRRVSALSSWESFGSSAGAAPARPGRYVGAADIEDDGEAFEQKMKRLSTKLEEQFAESAKLEKAIRNNLAALNFLRHERNESED
jgi:hypothetical protein